MQQCSLEEFWIQYEYSCETKYKYLNASRCDIPDLLAVFSVKEQSIMKGGQYI